MPTTMRPSLLTALAGAVVLAAAAPASAQWSVNGSHLYYTQGNVSIGTNNPAYRLYVVSPGPASIVGATNAAGAVAIGVQGQSSSTLGRGVYGYATAPFGQSYGGLFRTLSNQGVGVFATADAVSGVTAGIRGQSASTSGTGIWGISTATAGDTAGIRAQAASNAGSGILAFATASTGFTNGAFCQSNSNNGAGLFALAAATSGETYGVYGETSSPNGFGVYSVGDSATVGAKLFQIDHPLDPANRLLNHYSAEGPEPYLVYRGNVTLDNTGAAAVTLPAYFEAINIEPTYQLTPIGAQASLYIAEEIKDGRFVIAGGRPGMKVSWTVTGIRNDPIIRKQGIRTEPMKSAAQRGRYLRPDVYNLPASMAARPRARAQLAPAVDPATLAPARE